MKTNNGDDGKNNDENVSTKVGKNTVMELEKKNNMKQELHCFPKGLVWMMINLGKV